MRYDEALRYLYSFTDYEKKSGYNYSPQTFDLRRPRALLGLLGDPQDRFPSILVAGTKGKGSTAAMIASILQASGRRVGLYSQPHFHTFRERIRINGKPILAREMAAAVERVMPAVEEIQRTHPELGIPTTYEVATAAAMDYFARQEPDLVVLEVGLGGRLDATNVVRPLVSVITPVSLDHVALLGNTIAQIAGEKAGIIKEEGTVVATQQTEEGMGVIRRVSEERSARLVVARPDTANENGGPPRRPVDRETVTRAQPLVDQMETVLRGPSGTAYRVRLPLLGDHQLVNAATAIAVIEELGKQGFPVEVTAVEAGLRQVRWPGRLEIVSREPLVVVDGAHNAHSAEVLADALKKYFAYRRMILVLGTSADKDVQAIVSNLVPEAWMVITTRSRHARAADPDRLAEEARKYCSQVEVTSDLPAAMALATALAEPSDLICVTGSLFIVADAREHFGLAAGKD